MDMSSNQSSSKTLIFRNKKKYVGWSFFHHARPFPPLFSVSVDLISTLFMPIVSPQAMKDVAIAIGVHGANLVNCVLQPPYTVLLELMPYQFEHLMYVEAGHAGIKYYTHQMTTGVEAPNRNQFTSAAECISRDHDCKVRPPPSTETESIHGRWLSSRTNHRTNRKKKQATKTVDVHPFDHILPSTGALQRSTSQLSTRRPHHSRQNSGRCFYLSCKDGGSRSSQICINTMRDTLLNGYVPQRTNSTTPTFF